MPEELWESWEREKAANAQTARDRLAALQGDERDDPYQSMARQQVAQESLQPAPESFYGYSPGWDWGDALHNPITSAIGTGLGAAGWTLDTLGRGARSAISEGADLLTGRDFDPYRPINALWNNDVATSATDLRRRFAFNDIGKEGDGATWGDVPDVAADLLTSIATDPLSYLLPGATKAGEKAAVGGRQLIRSLENAGRYAPEAELMQGLRQAGGEVLEQGAIGPRLKGGAFFDDLPEAAGPLPMSREIAQREAIQQSEAMAGKQFTDEAGNFLPQYGTGTTPHPNFRGTEPNFFGRLNAGEESLALGVPFTPLQTGPLIGQNAPEWAKTAGNVAAGIADPIRSLGAAVIPQSLTNYTYGVANALKQSSFGLWAGKQLNAVAEVFTEAGDDNAGGVLATTIRNNQPEIDRRIYEMNDIAKTAQLTPDEESLTRALSDEFDPIQKEPTLSRAAASPALDELQAHEIGNKITPKQRYEEVQSKILGLSLEKQAAVYAISNQRHALNHRMLEFFEESGLGTTTNGMGVLEAAKKAARDVIEIGQKEIDEIDGKYGVRPPGAKEEPVLREYVELLKAKAPDAYAARASVIDSLERAQNEGFRTSASQGPGRGDAWVAVADRIDEVLSTAHGEPGYLWKRLKHKQGYDGEEQIQGLIRQATGEDTALAQLRQQADHTTQDLNAVMSGAPGDANALRATLAETEAAIQKRTSSIESGVRNARGMTEQLPDGTSLIRSLKGADLTTPFHELAHVVRHALPEEDLAAVGGWLSKAHGVDISKGWNREADELYAKYFERYLQTGKAPVPELQGVFARLKKWFTEIFEFLKEKEIPMSPEIREHFDKLLGGRGAAGEGLAVVKNPRPLAPPSEMTKSGMPKDLPSEASALPTSAVVSPSNAGHRVLDLSKSNLRSAIKKQLGMDDRTAHAMEGAYHTLVSDVDYEPTHGFMLIHTKTNQLPVHDINTLERYYAKAMRASDPKTDMEYARSWGNTGGGFRASDVEPDRLRVPLEIPDTAMGKGSTIEVPKPVEVVIAREDPRVPAGQIAVERSMPQAPPSGGGALADVADKKGRDLIPATVDEVEQTVQRLADDMGVPIDALLRTTYDKSGKKTGSFVHRGDMTGFDKKAKGGSYDPVTGAVKVADKESAAHEIIHAVFDHMVGMSAKKNYVGKPHGDELVSRMAQGAKANVPGLNPDAQVAFQKLTDAIASADEWNKRLVDMDYVRPGARKDSYYSSRPERFARALEVGLAKRNEFAPQLIDRITREEFPQGAEAERIAEAVNEFIGSLKPGAFTNYATGETTFGLWQKGQAGRAFETQRQMKLRVKMTEAKEKLEALQNVANFSRLKAQAVPNYSPLTVSDAAQQAMSKSVMGSQKQPGAASTGMPAKGFVYKAGEGKLNELPRQKVLDMGLHERDVTGIENALKDGYYKKADREIARLLPDKPQAERDAVRRALMPDILEDVPMRAEEVEAAVRRGGTGTAATSGRDITDPAYGVTDVIRRMWKPGELDKFLETERKNIKFANTNDLQAYAARTQANLKTIDLAQLKQSYARVAQSVPATAWNNALAQARDGVSLDKIEREFNALGHQKLEHLFDPKTYKAMKAGTIDYVDVLKPGATPRDWELADAWAPKKGEPGTMEGHWVPKPFLEEFSRQTASYRDLGATLGAIQPALQGVMSVWKPFQTAYTLKYHIRNIASDLVRMVQMNAIDGQTGGDLAKLMAPRNWQNYAKSGLNRMEPFKAMQFEVGAGAKNFGGRAVIGGDELMTTLAERGVLSGAQDAAQVFDASEKLLRKEGGSTFATGVGMMDQFKRLISYREQATRAATALTFLRQGKSIDEAVLLTNRTLYDFKNLSPAATWLKQTGIAPFIGWSAKNIPAQAMWAMRNPGKMAALFRAVEMSQQGSLPPEALPSYMRNKFGIRMGDRINPATGRSEAVIYGVGGIIPMTDLVEAVGNPGQFIAGQVAPWWKAAGDQLFDETPDESISSVLGVPGANVSRLYKIGMGVPNARGEKETLVDFAASRLNPTSRTVIDSKKAIMSANAAAKSEERTAKTRWINSQARLNQSVAAFGPDDPSLEPLKRQAALNKASYFAAKAKYDRVATQLAQENAVP